MNRVNLITLGTKDIVKSHEFYKNLGFDTSIRGTEENPIIIFFRNEGSRIALYPVEELAKDVNVEHPPPISSGFTGITLAGAVIQKEPVKNDWGGYGGYFTDPDGYYWEVAYGADWEFDESNMLVIDDQ